MTIWANEIIKGAIMRNMKIEKQNKHKQPLIAKKTRASDYEVNKKKSLSGTPLSNATSGLRQL
jgi:hypothetical protein